MSDEKNLESAKNEAGSSKEVDPNAANMSNLGESTETKPSGDATGKEGGQTKDEGKTGNTVSEAQYKELESKLGSQGKELGDLRNFYDEISPLMEKLQERPDLVDAILKDKISPELIKPVAEGKVSTKDAKEVTKAHDEVKKELGDKYEKASPEEIKKLIEDKVNDVKKDFEKALSEKDQEKDYEDKIKDFIGSTPDFSEYADDIAKYIQDHPGLLDIKVAYDAVKGIALQAKYKEQEDKDAAELAKNVAANAGGGSGQSTSNLSKEEVLDKLIGKAKDPNSVF